MKLWAGRFQKETNILVNDFNSSIGFDARLYEQDIRGSIAHATMLGNQGIIEIHEAEKIIEGLKAILADIEDDKVEFSLDNEDIHMNIEAMLTERIGAALVGHYDKYMLGFHLSLRESLYVFIISRVIGVVKEKVKNAPTEKSVGEIIY